MFSSLNLCLFIFIFHLLPFVNLYRSWCFRHNESERRAVKWNLDDVHSLYFSLVDSGNTTTTGKEIFAFTAIKFFFSHFFFFGPHDEQICLGDYRVSFISSTLSLYLSLFCLNQCERLNTNFEKGAPRINTTKKSWKIIFFSAQMKKSERNCRPFPNVFWFILCRYLDGYLSAVDEIFCPFFYSNGNMRVPFNTKQMKDTQFLLYFIQLWS